jgi:hypothetical protein
MWLYSTKPGTLQSVSGSRQPSHLNQLSEPAAPCALACRLLRCSQLAAQLKAAAQLALHAAELLVECILGMLTLLVLLLPGLQLTRSLHRMQQANMIT